MTDNMYGRNVLKRTCRYIYDLQYRAKKTKNTINILIQIQLLTTLGHNPELSSPTCTKKLVH